MKSNVGKTGISMVALVITIIVLIVLTSAVVITGVGATKQAQLAVFYSNIDTVQELVSIQMGDNMIAAAMSGEGDNYKWQGIVEEPVVFEQMIEGLDKEVARISTTLLEKTSLPETEIDKYYVDNNGVVYYEGFVYEGQTLYTKGTNNTPVVVTNPTDGSYNAEKGVNSPKLMTGMVGIYWNNGVEVYSHINGENADYTRTNANEDFDYDQWYDYVDTTENANTSKWANAKTEDGSYWVWIPRYAYSIISGYHTSTAGEIKVEFLKGKTNEGVSGRTSWDNISGQGNWNVHPAFSYTTSANITTQLTGIWVAKYEMSGENASGTEIAPGDVILSNTVKAVSKPGVSSWRNITIGNMFTNAYNYNRDLESHLIKNIEWGAVAYLAHSQYGRNGTAISRNNSYRTGGGSGEAYKTNVLQSTTGNAYGIYDMSGGSYERTATYLSGAPSTNAEALIEADAKYKEVYDAGTTTDYGKIGGKINYGDAMYETSSNCMVDSVGSTTASWYNDQSCYIFPRYPFLVRGNFYYSGLGVFAFCYTYDIGDQNNSWRVVLW